MGDEDHPTMSGELAKASMSLADSLLGKPRALRVTEVATLLSISERQVYKLAKERLIPYFRIRGSIRFDPAFISEWLRQIVTPASVARIDERKRRA
jgi:excisionase family DNA binding protein